MSRTIEGELGEVEVVKSGLLWSGDLQPFKD
jgi:hypothetical protein